MLRSSFPGVLPRLACHHIPSLRLTAGKSFRELDSTDALSMEFAHPLNVLSGQFCCSILFSATIITATLFVAIPHVVLMCSKE